MKFPCIRFLSISLGVFFAFVYAAQAATYTVTNLNNSGGGSLRDAVAVANSTGDDDTIVFAANLGCANNACEIVLSGEIVINPVIGGRLRIDNTTSQAITLNANNGSRVFYVNGGFEINRLTLTGGAGFGSYDDASKTYGGAVFVNNGEFVMTNSAVRNSTTQSNAASRGGGIYLKAGAAAVNDSELTGNASVQGGAIYIQGGTMTLNRSLIANNRSQRTDNGSDSGGGGVYTAGGTLYALNTTITGNQALGTVTLTGIYGAMYIGQGTNAVYLTNCSVVYNSAARNTPGIFIPYADILRMRNTVVFGNAQTNGAVVDVLGEGFTSGGKNVFGVVQVNSGVGATDVQFATEAQVGIGRNLGNNGGATRTLPLAANSILIENGNNCARAFCSDYPEPLTVSVDARGVSRYSNGQNLDTGAIERYSTGFNTQPTLPNGTVRNSYSQTLAATTTGPFPIAYSVISGSLPPGLTLSSGGVLSGVPTQAGAFSFTVKAETTPNPDEGQTTQIFQLLIDPAQPLMVSNTNDSGAGSLRERLAQAAFTGNGTINFDFAPDDPNCSNGVCRINLTDQLTVNYSYPVTIDGAGASGIVISGNNQSRIFYNSPGANLTLKNLIVRDGNGTSLSHLAENGDGGGIVNRGTLRLENVWVTNNASSLYNGAISNHGNLTILNSTVSGNNSGYNSIYGTTGGVGSDGQLFIVNSTISGNRSHNNVAGGAGGIFNNNSDVYLVNTTVTDNQANTTARSDSAAGIRHVGTFGFFRLRNSIVAANRDNATAPDTIGVFSSSGNNLIGNKGASNFNQPGDQTGTGANLRNPLLASLGNYGGQTPTHALLNNSTARDAGNNCVLNAACDNLQLATDQRGSLAPRKTGTAVDIGAFESNISFSTSATGNGGQGTLPDAQAAQNYSITFTASRLSNLPALEGGEQSAKILTNFSYSMISGSLPFGLSFNPGTGELSGTVQQGGNYTFTILARDADGIAGAQSYNLTVLTPTAASVSIGGRVLTPEGRSLGNALIKITSANGESRTTTTSVFGYYRFADVPAGQTYVLQVISKRYQFAPLTVNLNEETNELNFVGQH